MNGVLRVCAICQRLYKDRGVGLRICPTCKERRKKRNE